MATGVPTLPELTMIFMGVWKDELFLFSEGLRDADPVLLVSAHAVHDHDRRAGTPRHVRRLGGSDPVPGLRRP